MPGYVPNGKHPFGSFLPQCQLSARTSSKVRRFSWWMCESDDRLPRKKSLCLPPTGPPDNALTWEPATVRITADEALLDTGEEECSVLAAFGASGKTRPWLSNPPIEDGPARWHTGSLIVHRCADRRKGGCREGTRMKRWLAGGLILIGLVLAGCQMQEGRESRGVPRNGALAQMEVTIRQ
jgi:hypothetical protein